jgi:hypothetical protein
MARATEAQRAQMAADVAAVEEQLRRGLQLVGLGALLNADSLLRLAAPWTSLLDVRDRTTAETVKGLEGVRQQLVRWRDTWRRWAEAGQRDDGTAYSVERWREAGRELAEAIRWWTGQSVSRTAFVAVAQAVADTPRSLRQSAEAAETAGLAVVRRAQQAAEAAGALLGSLPSGEEWRRAKRVAVAAGAVVLGAVVLGVTGYFIRSVR